MNKKKFSRKGLSMIIVVLFAVVIWLGTYFIRSTQLGNEINDIHGIDTEAFIDNVVSIDNMGYDEFISGKHAGDTFSGKVKFENGMSKKGVQGYVVVGDNSGFQYDDSTGIIKVVIKEDKK